MGRAIPRSKEGSLVEGLEGLQVRGALAATTIGLENGLAKAIELKFEPKIVISSSEYEAVTVPAKVSDPPKAPAAP